MAEYLIRCVNTEHPHRHIVSAEIQRLKGTEYGDRELVTLSTILSMMDAGHVFNTYSPALDRMAEVHGAECKVDDVCDFETIRSDADAVTDNNLDNLICP
jgi:hypothetical protein